MKRFTIGCAFLVLLFAARAEAQPAKRIRIGSTTPSITTLPSDIASRKGFFKQEGLDPEMITIRSADIIIKALLTDNLDYATTLISLVGAAVKGLPIKVFGVTVKKTSYVMVSHPAVKSIRDLKGKVVGISSFGAASDYVVRVALQKGGLDPKKDVTLIQVGGSAGRLSALQSGSIQATVLVAPFDLQAEKMGYRSLLWLGKVMDLPQGGFGAHEKKLRENPDEIVRLMRATSRGMQFIKSQKEETVRFTMEWLNLDRSVAESVYPLLIESLADFGITDDSVLESAVEAAKFQDRVDKEISLDQIRDWSFAKKARDDLRKQGSVR